MRPTMVENPFKLSKKYLFKSVFFTIPLFMFLQTSVSVFTTIYPINGRYYRRMGLHGVTCRMKRRLRRRTAVQLMFCGINRSYMCIYCYFNGFSNNIRIANLLFHHIPKLQMPLSTVINLFMCPIRGKVTETKLVHVN